MASASSVFGGGVASFSVAGGGMVYSSVAKAWDKEFLDSDGDESMSPEVAAVKMALLFDLEGEDVKADLDVDLDVKPS